MRSVIGSAPSPDGVSVDPSEHRHFIIETSVYDGLKAALAQLLVVCFLYNTKRWEKVKTLLRNIGGLCYQVAWPSGKDLDLGTATRHLAHGITDLSWVESSTWAAVQIQRPSFLWVYFCTTLSLPEGTPSISWSGRGARSNATVVHFIFLLSFFLSFFA